MSIKWDINECIEISRTLSNFATLFGGLSIAAVKEEPKLSLVLAIVSFSLDIILRVFNNYGVNGVKLSLMFGFIPIYFGGY